MIDQQKNALAIIYYTLLGYIIWLTEYVIKHLYIYNDFKNM